MGTERYEVHNGPCSCGKGKHLVYECSPDHPFAKESQSWWEFNITCPDCKRIYELEKRGNKVYRILLSEIAKKKNIKTLWMDTGKKVMKRFESEGHLDAFKVMLLRIPSVAEKYRTLKPILHLHVSEGTFRNHFNECRTIGEWINKNIRSSHIASIMDWLGRQDAELNSLLAKERELWEEARKDPDVVMPEVCTLKKD